MITIKALLEAGVHFGHQTNRWNPKMKPYIFGERNGIYIIDLEKTLQCFQVAYNFVRDTVASGESVWFVGTKRQAMDIIEEEAKRCNMFYVNQRWLGGMLTNFQTLKRSIALLKKLEAAQTDGTYERLKKKEIIRLEKRRARLEKYLSGIKGVTSLPGCIYIVDTRVQHIAVQEANRMSIPIVAIVDTNCDPTPIDYPIPGNDDAIRSIKLFTSHIADACLEGLELRQKREHVEDSEDRLMAEMLSARAATDVTENVESLPSSS